MCLPRPLTIPCINCTAPHGHGVPSLASDEELVSDRSLAVLTELAAQVRAGRRIVDSADAAGQTAAPAYHHGKLTTMLQV